MMPKNASLDASPVYQYSLGFLALSSWISGIAFALYIFGFYITASTLGAVEAWNSVLPNLYTPTKPAAMTGMISHFFFGSVLLILGPIQFSQTLRQRYTNVHRWTGVFYTLSAFITGFGGVVFLGVWGASGGTPMVIGFGLYGILMMICSVQTIRFALNRDFTRHRQWAVRLFALVLGSWLYRMGYGFIYTNLGGWGIAPKFTGPMDYVMDYAFFVIPLLVAEIIIQGKKSATYSIWQNTGALLCVLGGVLILQATYFFLNTSWGSAISSLVGA